MMEFFLPCPLKRQTRVYHILLSLTALCFSLFLNCICYTYVLGFIHSYRPDTTNYIHISTLHLTLLIKKINYFVFRLYVDTFFSFPPNWFCHCQSFFFGNFAIYCWASFFFKNTVKAQPCSSMSETFIH